MPLDLVAAAREHTLRFGALAREVAPDRAVPHLPGWTVHHLVAHLTGDHEWALGILRSGQQPARGLRASRRRGASLLDHYDAVSADLLDALADAARHPDRPCHNFAQGSAGTRGWWPRHQAHEVSVHLADLETVAGVPPTRDPAFSADGVTELFETYANRYPRQRLTREVVLRATGHGAWRVVPTGPGRLHGALVDDPGRADLEAPADLLLLALWHRVPADDPRLAYGPDPGPARELLAGPLTA